jgi:hypothetical protein
VKCVAINLPPIFVDSCSLINHVDKISLPCNRYIIQVEEDHLVGLISIAVGSCCF